VPGTLPLGIKQPGSEADDSLPSSAEVKNMWSYTSSWHGAQLKHRHNLPFTIWLQKYIAKSMYTTTDLITYIITQ
jgi:hypothetical protein